MIEITFPDQWPERFAWLTAMTTFLVGLWLMIMPRSAMARLGLASADATPVGVSEVRGAFGGVFAGLGFACILLAQPFTYFALGLAFTFAVIGRVLSMIFDRAFHPQCLFATFIDVLGATFTLYFSGQALGLIG